MLKNSIPRIYCTQCRRIQTMWRQYNIYDNILLPVHYWLPCIIDHEKFHLFCHTNPEGIEFLLHSVAGDNSRCARTESEKSRQKIREGVRNRIYSRTIILPVISRHPSKEVAILRNATKDMSQVPLIATEDTSTTEPPISSKVILEVKKRNYVYACI